ncbi:ferritin [Streptomyces sp. CNQ-509]|uniref:Dps family protein n=1 Tax=unclassified Streptomyces TaxID=2593676 RepID=UPI00062DE03B|nr:MULTISPECIES: DNA starvation/stationary phase protection protein [unclassified Streptomyces]AKH86137.1 ferritin [Streptomyces sp. CNQ-509]AZM50184.1 DNA starvation/stationary phase protection protein [Streptomyces sp. WAC 06738]
MTTILDKKALDVTGEALQGALVDLLDLSLQGKQAHWNLTGPLFRELHLQLDKMVKLARGHADTLAERAAALGVSPDGRAKTIAANSPLPDIGPGKISDQKVIDDVTDMLEKASARMRQRVADTDDTDLITQDLLITATQDLEQQAWFFRSHRIS